MRAAVSDARVAHVACGSTLPVHPQGARERQAHMSSAPSVGSSFKN